MNNKYAYVAAITNNLFIPCLIRSAQITKFKGRKYPFVVLVTKDITDKDIQLLEDFDIICKRIPYFVLSSHIYECMDYRFYSDVGINYAALSLIEYDKVFVFEADILLLTNCDILLETAEFKKNQYFICNNILGSDFNYYKNKIFNHPETQIFLCRPSLQIYKNFLQICVWGRVHEDHSLMNIFFYNSINKKNIMEIEYIHFAGRPKIWECFKDFRFFNNIFYNWDIKTLAHFLSDKNIEKIEQFTIDYLRLFEELGNLQLLT